MKLVIKHIKNGRYEIVDEATGAVKRGPIHGRADAERQVAAMEREAARKASIRPCMCCRASFESEGIHNRLCRTCGSSNQAAFI